MRFQKKKRFTIDQLVRLETFMRDTFVNKDHAVSVFFGLEKSYYTMYDLEERYIERFI